MKKKTTLIWVIKPFLCISDFIEILWKGEFILNVITTRSVLEVGVDAFEVNSDLFNVKLQHDCKKKNPTVIKLKQKKVSYFKASATFPVFVNCWERPRHFCSWRENKRGRVVCVRERTYRRRGQQNKEQLLFVCLRITITICMNIS